jgi:hypothetical protein
MVGKKIGCLTPVKCAASPGLKDVGASRGGAIQHKLVMNFGVSKLILAISLYLNAASGNL